QAFQSSWTSLLAYHFVERSGAVQISARLSAPRDWTSIRTTLLHFRRPVVAPATLSRAKAGVRSQQVRVLPPEEPDGAGGRTPPHRIPPSARSFSPSHVKIPVGIGNALLDPRFAMIARLICLMLQGTHPCVHFTFCLIKALLWPHLAWNRFASSLSRCPFGLP